MLSRYPFVTILLCGIVVMLLPVAAIFFSLTFDCGADNVRRIMAPDNHHKVIVFRKNCGATTAYSTQAVLLPVWRPFILAFSNPFFVSAEEDHLDVHWRDNDAVDVVFPKTLRTFRRDPKVDDIAIFYR
jgi:hypothetical protein